ncbi:MAG: excinuclease ABC subunit UvrB [Flavobacteriia bacterium]|nr:excinuclease ABC subunit UvrB [Flavobacteriia bacterium]
MNYKLISDYLPTGDQPEAIAQLVFGVQNNVKYQTLLGVTGSGKTFTIANVIEKINKPILVLSHNKTLAAQLYGEFKQFFPENAVEYFVSYYDYYQPEAYLPVTDTFIEKDLAINDELERMRLSATSALLSGRKDVIVVSSVSCIYGIGNPKEFEESIITIEKNQYFSRNKFLYRLVENLYSRAVEDKEGNGFIRGTFRVKGDVVDIFLAYADYILRVEYFGDQIEAINRLNPLTLKKEESMDNIRIYPANLFVSHPDTQRKAIEQIEKDLEEEVLEFKNQGKTIEAVRLKERVEYDVEMIRELGYCSGIENYSRYFDQRKSGSRPFCLIDYFPKDFLLIIDESHVTIPQIKAMYGGDRSRKMNLVDFGFRLKAAIDNRPLKFEEFEEIIPQIIFVSATPSVYELEKSEGIVVEQVIRPTGLLDPTIEIRPSLNQIDDLLDEIQFCKEKNERVLVTTLTKRMAEELHKFLENIGILSSYIHSDIDTIERVEILRKLRLGVFDVLIGVNLLKEGLDLPEVALVAIIDADKEGFLRDERSLVQTIGRAARNVNGRVIMYADRITNSMEKTIKETNRRRTIQMDHNLKNGISPKSLNKTVNQIMESTKVADGEKESSYESSMEKDLQYLMAEENSSLYENSSQDLTEKIRKMKKKMEKAAKDLDFISAAKWRDEIKVFEEHLKKRK